MSTEQSSDRAFNYEAPAELFPGRNRRARIRVAKYMRFGRAADAIRFAIEDLPTDLLLGAFLVIDEQRYGCSAIRSLYEGADYPLPRRAKVA